jgi:hypothetical protein
VLGLLLIAALAVAAIEQAADRGTVYSVAAVERHLAQEPYAWGGRTVLVQGEAQVTISHTWRSGCEQAQLVCTIVQTAWSLGDPGAPSLVAYLPLQLSAPDPLRALLRQAPLIGRLVPPPQVIHPGITATYRIQLCAMPHGTDGTGYQALLLDAAQ